MRAYCLRSTHNDTHRHIHTHAHPSLPHILISIGQHKRPYAPFLICVCATTLHLKGGNFCFTRVSLYSSASVLEGIFKSHIAIVLTLTVFHSPVSIQLYVLSDLQRSERKFSDYLQVPTDSFIYSTE